MVTHQWYRRVNSVRKLLNDAYARYTLAGRHGIDLSENRAKVYSWVKRTHESQAQYELATTIKVLFFFNLAEVSKEFHYQPFHLTDAEELPTLPQYIQDAVVAHRKRHGESSIF
jgi:hypothetical protein